MSHHNHEQGRFKCLVLFHCKFSLYFLARKGEKKHLFSFVCHSVNILLRIYVMFAHQRGRDGAHGAGRGVHLPYAAPLLSTHLVKLPPSCTMRNCASNVKTITPRNMGFFRPLTMFQPFVMDRALNSLKICERNFGGNVIGIFARLRFFGLGT